MSKTLAEWSRDPQCVVSAQTFFARIARGWTLEDAIFVEQLRSGKAKLITAFGETHSLMEWARDIRCQVPWACLQSRVDAGWDAEDALSTPSGMQRIEAFGERKSLASWVRDPHCLVSEGILRKRLKQGLNAEAAIKTPPTSIFKHKKFVAFGEAKLIGDWWRDPRCCVPLQTLYSRVKAGYPFEAALTSPSRKAKPKDETR